MMQLPPHELKDFLEFKYDQYNRESFIESDPVSIPHRYTLQEDIEISAFLTATIAWGQRKSIIGNASRLMDQMGNTPYSFLIEASTDQLLKASQFVHRTFNATDTLYFFKALKNIFQEKGGLKGLFEQSYLKYKDMRQVLAYFRTIFLGFDAPERTGKHISDVMKGASAKRLNMFLRWMVRNDNRGVDFGLWNEIPASALYLPLDLHTGNVSRKLELLQRKQNDWNAVEEVTSALRGFDASDPVKYDYALFGLGIFEHF